MVLMNLALLIRVGYKVFRPTVTITIISLAILQIHVLIFLTSR
jgi:hypothetical protein